MSPGLEANVGKVLLSIVLYFLNLNMESSILLCRFIFRVFLNLNIESSILYCRFIFRVWKILVSIARLLKEISAFNWYPPPQFSRNFHNAMVYFLPLSQGY